MSGYQYRCVVSNSAGEVTSDAVTLTVNKATVPVSSVTLNKNVLSLVEGASETLTATVQPTDATNKGVTWSSNNTAVATVENGKVTAVKEGVATITVTTTDGGKTATCAVTVNKPAPAEFVITFDPNGGYVSYTSAVTSGGKLSALPFAS
ncbi:MAG TPA: Ig domain-containing protein, partial [Candidatus Faecivivens stercoripullorum]|nr:Ig domain-containing protein [Candidatus Faecivivens stercoripullorum]